MDDNIKYLIFGLIILCYGYYSLIDYKKYHEKKWGYNSNYSPVTIRSVGLIFIGLIIILINIYRMIV